jgi:pyruvate kinase
LPNAAIVLPNGNLVLLNAALVLLLQGARRYGSEEAPPIDWIVPPTRRATANTDAALSEMFAYHATTMANTVHAPLMVFSRQGNMPSLLSHYRPDYPVFAFTGRGGESKG